MRTTVSTTEKFLDLYRSSRELLDRHGVVQLEAYRSSAVELLERVGLPRSWSEHYKRFHIDEVLMRPWSFNFERNSFGANPSKEHPCSMALPSISQTFLLDDRVHSMASDLPEGVFFGPLSSFCAKYPEVFERYYNRMSSVRECSLSQLNTLFAQDVCVVYVASGVKLSDPLQVINLSGIAPEVLSFPRYLVIAEEASQATILMCDHSAGEGASLRLSVAEYYVGRGARLECYDVEESGSQAVRIHNVHVHQEADSDVRISSLTVQNGQTRNNFFADLAGQGASFDLDGMCLLDGDQKADNFSIIRHSVPHCHSNELFKYTLNDRSLGSFTGRIYVARDAQKTAAYQNNRNLVLSDTARMYSKPQLEIYADDVKCSHGMTTGQLDEGALFYMQQRGIPYMEAKLMLTIAFMSDVLDTIRFEPLRVRLASVVDRRFRGLPATCQNCGGV